MDPDQHCATYAVGVFVADLRGRGLGREVTWLALAWAFGVLGVHRVQLEVLASNRRAINCYLACGFSREGVRREAQLYPDGWKDFILMGLLQSEYASLTTAAVAAHASHRPVGSGARSSEPTPLIWERVRQVAPRACPPVDPRASPQTFGRIVLVPHARRSISVDLGDDL